MSDGNTASSNDQAPDPAISDATKSINAGDCDFDEDIIEEERQFYKNKFKDLGEVKHEKVHCTSCDKHLGCAPRKENLMRRHPMLRTLVCNTCHTFYNSGEFEKGDDGSELYCRWCGQGGQVYCCSDCPHVFCAKCIRRNLGNNKIKEIESTDDWKCFKCAPKSLWDLRALCWALLRYCDVKNKLAYQTQDSVLRDKYQKECTVDDSECCKDKRKRSSVNLRPKEEKKDVEDVNKIPANVMAKIPPSIQVKKFASIIIEDSPEKKVEKRKRSNSPIKPVINQFKNPITVTPLPNLTKCYVPPAKKVKSSNPTSLLLPSGFKVVNEKKPSIAFPRMPILRPKFSLPVPIQNAPTFNGYSQLPNDNINLSLESLTQGLDFTAVASMAANITDNDDVVCTPDLPMEPICETIEDTIDDDVECITPGPIAVPKISAPPPLLTKTRQSLPGLSPGNIIQMTENDVTVNTFTGGLKFRVDPQTLSSNKMYRLPDGRIFAINANPNMPGGYSATIVALTDEQPATKTGTGKTYAAKITAPAASPSQSTQTQKRKGNKKKTKSSKSVTTRTTRSSIAKSRDVDLKVPVEWYRYNLIDAVDALEYSLSRLNRLRKDVTTVYLRSRSIQEMRSLHRTLDRLLSTSASRFGEIKTNLNRGLKDYVSKKSNADEEDDDDDDVEILSNDCDDPIFIDENSCDSNSASGHQEVDLLSDTNDDYDKDKTSNKLDGSVIVNDLSSEKLNDSGDSSKFDDVEKSVDVLLPNHNQNEKPKTDESINTESVSLKKNNDILTSSDNDKQKEIEEDIIDNKSKDGDHANKTDKIDSKLNGDTNAIDEEKEIIPATNDKLGDEKLNDDSNVTDGNNKVIESLNDDSLLTDGNDETIDTLNDDLQENEDKLLDPDLTDKHINELLKDDSPDKIAKLSCLESLQENSSILSN